MQLTQDLLVAAIAGLEAKKQRVETQIRDLRASMGKRGPGRPPAASKSAPHKRRKRKLSPEGRAAIIAATKRRWAAVRKAKKAPEILLIEHLSQP
jgi:hypothetical protein